MKDKPRWKELCELASVEQDPQKFMELITEIDQLLEEKQNRLKQSGEPKSPDKIPRTERFDPTRIQE
jgi:hypothetical protein